MFRKVSIGFVRLRKVAFFKHHATLRNITQHHATLNRKAFTYIELMITVMIIAICFVPLMSMFSSSIKEMTYAGDKLTALNLAREEMEKIKNLNFTEAQLLALGNTEMPPNGKALVRNNVNWRIERTFGDGSDPLEVRVSVYRESKAPQKMIELVTLIEDLEWAGVD